MTIRAFEGVPGSGKGIHATEVGLIGMNRRGGVLANYPVVRPKKRRDGSPKWVFVPTEEMTPDYFKEHAERYHREGVEGEGLIIIDECHRVLNSRTTWTGRKEIAGKQYQLVQFLAESRHWGYDVVLIVQNLNMLDKQVREALIEERVKHFKWNSFWFMKWLPFPVFGRVTFNAQFRQMKGRVSFSTGIMAYGRYDHLWWRKLERARRAAARGGPAFAPEALAGPRVSGVAGVFDASDVDGVGGAEPGVESAGGRVLVPHQVITAPALPAVEVGSVGTPALSEVAAGGDAFGLQGPRIEGVDEDAELVLGEYSDVVSRRAFARLVHEWRSWSLSASSGPVTKASRT